MAKPRLQDTLNLAMHALGAHPVRTLLILSAMAIGVAAVVVLSTLGDGARRFVTHEFSSLGSHLIIVVPGRSETAGAGAHMMVGETPRDLTIDDALALKRSSAIATLAPVNVGSAPVSYGAREREVPIFGSTGEMFIIRHLKMAQGRFLPLDKAKQALPVVVIGNTIRQELFGSSPALGKWLRIGERRFRVIGVLASEGESLGMNQDEAVIIPAASAQSLFNTYSLFRIIVQAKSRESIPRAMEFIRKTLKERHQGEEDVTIVTQDAMLATFDNLLRALTYSVTGIAAISLLVAGVLIMNVMLVSISQRTSEIGLLKAIGATPKTILNLFLTEAFLLSFLGAALGIIIGVCLNFFVHWLLPQIPATPPWWSVFGAMLVAMSTGVLFGVLPARRAAMANAIDSLAKH